MKVLAVTGSLSAQSTTHQAVEIIGKAAREAGVEVEFFDLREFPLPLYDDREDDSTYPENVHIFKQKMSEADGFIFGSPEYHGSISGVMKNALDFIEGRDLKGKIVALVATAGGAMGATNTLNTMSTICRQLHAWVLPSLPSVGQSYLAFHPDGTLKDEKLQQRLEQHGRNLAKTLLTVGAQIRSNA